MLIDSRMALSQEEQVLIGCSRWPLDELAWLDGLTPKQIDWETVARLALRHGITNLLRENLERAGLWPCLPEKVRTSLATFGRQWQFREAMCTQQIRKIVEALAHCDARLVFSKGIALAALLYHEGPRREYGDLDILVQDDKVDQVFHILTDSLGFKPLYDFTYWMPNPLAFHHWPPIERNGLSIDLHVKLGNPRFVGLANMERILQSAQLADYNGVQLFVPSPPHLLTHLCVHLYTHHAVNHKNCSLRHHADIRNLSVAYREQMDWKAFVEAALGDSIHPIIAYSLYYTEAIYGRFLPTGVLEAVTPPDFNELKNAIKAEILQEDVIIGYWKIPYLRRLLDEGMEERIEREIWAAVQAHLLPERWYAASEAFGRTGSDPRQLRFVNKVRETAG